MRRKRGLRVVGMLVGIGVALLGVAIGFAPREYTVWLQTAPGSNADIVCVDRPAAAREGDAIIIATKDGVAATPIARTARTHCTPCEGMLCATTSGIISCL